MLRAHKSGKPSERLAVDTLDLMELLSCGRPTAVKIGKDSGARIQIGKRVLWNVAKVQKYLDEISTKGDESDE